MLDRKIVEEQLNFTLGEMDLPALGTKIPGKVRDSYVVGDKRVLVTSDRISAFDVILSTIPFKGQLLNDMAAYWFDETKQIVKNHLLDRPHPNVFITRQAEILPVEVVVRGYLTGSAWRDYSAGKNVSGIKIPAGMKSSQKFETPLITPSTKAERGQHDLPISSEEIVKQGLVEAKLWGQVAETALELFRFGTERAARQGLILVDTKYEFGVLPSGELVLADEVHTSDSSRYWIQKNYQAAFEKGEEPKKLDKEFLRGWLMDRNYMGDGTPPKLDDKIRVDVALRYMEAYEKITGREFQAQVGPVSDGIRAALKTYNL